MQLGVEFVDLTAVSIPVELASYVPKNIAKKFCVVPVKLVKDTLYLSMSDPLDFAAQEEVKVASRKRVIPMIATRRTTEHAISLLYGSEGTAGVIEEYPELHISASIGGAFAAGRISRTIRRADLAMYQAKLKKDCVAIYREEKERET